MRALASGTVTLWLAGSSVATALLAAVLEGCTIGAGSRRPHRPDAEIRTHGSLLASLEFKSQPLSDDNYDPAALNVVLENALNTVLKSARTIYEKCLYFAETCCEAMAQSERLTASGVMCRGPGAARRPAEV